MDQNKDIELIERYLNYQLEETERAAFENRLATDLAFAEEFERHQAAHKALDFMIAKNLKAQLEEMEQQTAQEAKIVPLRSRSRRLLFIRTAAAALILLAIGFFYLYFPQDTRSGSELAGLHYTAPDYTLRSGSTAPESTLDRGLAALEANDYPQAINTLDSIQTDNDFYLQAQYFKAHALYLNQEFGQAENLFEQVSLGNDIRYQQEAQWYSTLSCLAQNKACIAKLEAIMENEEHEYREEAEEIRKAVD